MILRGPVPLVALLACACGPVSLGTPHPTDLRIESQLIPLQQPRLMLDLLVVVDRSAAMVEHRDALARVLSDLGYELAGRPYYELHLGIVAADLVSDAPGCPRAAGPGRLQSIDVQRPFLSVACDGKANFTGPMNVAITVNGQLAPGDGCGPNQALVAMQMALAPDDLEALSLNPGFVRPGSHVSILFISASDDESRDGTGRLHDTASVLDAVRQNHLVRTVALTAGTASRLASLNDGCPDAEPLDAPGHAAAMRCLIPELPVPSALVTSSQVRDRDPSQAGLQPDCAVMVRSGNELLSVLPPCESGEARCWRLIPVPGGPATALQLEVQGYGLFWGCDDLRADVQCATYGPTSSAQDSTQLP